MGTLVELVSALQKSMQAMSLSNETAVAAAAVLEAPEDDEMIYLSLRSLIEMETLEHQLALKENRASW